MKQAEADQKHVNFEFEESKQSQFENERSVRIEETVNNETVDLDDTLPNEDGLEPENGVEFVYETVRPHHCFNVPLIYMLPGSDVNVYIQHKLKKTQTLK